MSLAAGSLPTVATVATAHPAVRAAPALVLGSVSNVHPGGVRALDGVSLTVDAGASSPWWGPRDDAQSTAMSSR